MSKEQTLPANVREQIEREYQIDNDGNLTQKISSVTRRNAAIRGAEIALEKQWIDSRIDPPPYKVWVDVWVEKKKMSFMAYANEVGEWESPFSEVHVYRARYYKLRDFTEPHPTKTIERT